MVQEDRDPLTGAERGSVLVSRHDALERGLQDGDPIVLRNEHGELRGRVKLAALKPGNLQVHWPEAEVLIDRTRRSPEAGIPDYNTVVTLGTEVAS
jgi:anaerobic selenocysteine-containing dehydrogenase